MIFYARPLEGVLYHVGVEDLAKKVREESLSLDDWVIDASQKYGYCSLAISNPLGIVVVWCGKTSRPPDDCISREHAADDCYPGTGILFADNAKEEKTLKAYKQHVRECLKKDHENIVPAMVVIALASKETSTKPSPQG